MNPDDLDRETTPNHRSELSVRDTIRASPLVAALLVIGVSYGLAVALGPGGGTIPATMVGLLVLPLALLHGLAWWLFQLQAWLTERLGYDQVLALRRDGRVRDVLQSMIEALGPRRSHELPGRWGLVFVPSMIGAVGAFGMVMLSRGDRSVAGVLIALGAIALGMALSSLARHGHIPIPEGPWSDG